MPLDFRDGDFRVSVCEARKHVTLEVVEGDRVRFVCVMSMAEAGHLAAGLAAAAAGGRAGRSLSPSGHRLVSSRRLH